MITFLLKRMSRKQRIATYLAAMPPNGKRDDEIGELVHTAYGGKRHIHDNPKGGKRRKEVQGNE